MECKVSVENERLTKLVEEVKGWAEAERENYDRLEKVNREWVDKYYNIMYRILMAPIRAKACHTAYHTNFIESPDFKEETRMGKCGDCFQSVINEFINQYIKLNPFFSTHDMGHLIVNDLTEAGILPKQEEVKQ